MKIILLLKDRRVLLNDGVLCTISPADGSIKYFEAIYFACNLRTFSREGKQITEVSLLFRTAGEDVPSSYLLANIESIRIKCMDEFEESFAKDVYEKITPFLPKDFIFIIK